MHFYRVVDTAHPPEDAPRPRFEATQFEAHNVAKAKPECIRPCIRIELVDVAADKADVCRILNDDRIDHKVLRTWKLTPRGGLVDCLEGE